MTTMNIEQKAGMDHIVRDIRRERDALKKSTQEFYKFIGVGFATCMAAIGTIALAAIYQLNIGPMGAVAGTLFATTIASLYFSYEAANKIQSHEEKISGMENQRNRLSNEATAFVERQEKYAAAEEQRKLDIQHQIEAEKARRAEVNEIANRMRNMREGSMDMIVARVKL